MASSETNGWLPDVNVWLALCSDRHEHYHIAVAWLEAVQTSVYFCRVTQMALLRLLTNPKVMASDTLTPQSAVGVYKELRLDERVRYADEPVDIEDLWLSLMTVPSANGKCLTDAWLAAFALSNGSKLVTFDAGMRRWAALQPWCWVSNRTTSPTGFHLAQWNVVDFVADRSIQFPREPQSSTLGHQLI